MDEHVLELRNCLQALLALWKHREAYPLVPPATGPDQLRAEFAGGVVRRVERALLHPTSPQRPVAPSEAYGLPPVGEMSDRELIETAAGYRFVHSQGARRFLLRMEEQVKRDPLSDGERAVLYLLAMGP